MDFTERMLERNRSRHMKTEVKEGNNQTSAPLKEVHHNTVTTMTSTGGSNKVTIETTVTMRKLPKRTSSPRKEDTRQEEETTTTCTEGDTESTDEKENDTSPDISCPLRQNTKSRLQRLGVLYSDDPSRLSSPIHRTEERFLAEKQERPVGGRKVPSAAKARLAALADTINHWEDDVKQPPVAGEAQGFARSESSQKLVYDYNKRDESPSPPRTRTPSPVKPPSPVKGWSPVKAWSPVKPTSPVKSTSPVKGKSPVRATTPFNETSPVKEMFEHRNEEGSGGMKQTRCPCKVPATAPPLSPTKRCRDPAELPLAERMALFERNASGAVLPKAPFGMPVPAKKLQQSSHSDKPSTQSMKDAQKGKPLSKTSQASGSSSSIHGRLAVFERGTDNSKKEHMREILTERQKEMDMLKHRWDRYKGTSDPEPQLSAPPPSPPPPPPVPSPPKPFEYGQRRNSGYYYEEDEEETRPQHKVVSPQLEKPEKAYPVLKDVKKIKLSPPKPGCLYPCLSDMEVESETQESEREEKLSHRSSSGGDSDISSESYGSSMGQDIVRVSRTSLKRDWPASDQSGNEENDNNEMFDLLDEDLDNLSDEPTPPKRSSYSHNVGSVHSRSFEYSQNVEERSAPAQPLLHTISIYRKQQSLTVKPPSPARHIQSEPSAYSTDDSIDRLEEELDRELKLVEQKINMLQQEVRTQQTIISQATQALNLCYSTFEFSGSTEQLEAEKLLLLASERRQAALHEIQRLRVEQYLRPNKTLTERGSLTLSKITVPLRMDVIHQAAKDDQCCYLLCLVHSDERVWSTDVVCAPRSLHNHNLLTFPNTLTLDGLYSDFKVTVEIYTMTARSKEVIPHDVKYHINVNKKEVSKLRLTPRKAKGESRLVKPPVQSPGGPSAVRTSAFTRAGYVIFSLREINRTQFTLNKNAYTSVLEGSLQVRISSEMCVDVVFRGFLTMFEDISGFGAWHRRWCLLKGDTLSYWKYPDDEGKKIALDTIELSSCITREVDLVPRDVCARSNTFLLETTRPYRSTDVSSIVLVTNGNQTTIRHLLSADSKEERLQWCHYLNKALALMRAWGVAAK